MIALKEKEKLAEKYSLDLQDVILMEKHLFEASYKSLINFPFYIRIFDIFYISLNCKKLWSLGKKTLRKNEDKKVRYEFEKLFELHCNFCKRFDGEKLQHSVVKKHCDLLKENNYESEKVLDYIGSERYSKGAYSKALSKYRKKSQRRYFSGK